MPMTDEEYAAYKKKKADDAAKAEALRQSDIERAKANKAAQSSKYQDYVDNSAPTQETVQVNPSVSTYDAVNAANRSAFMDAVSNGYSGTYAQYVADKNAGRVR